MRVARAPDGAALAALCKRRDGGVRRADAPVRLHASVSGAQFDLRWRALVVVPNGRAGPRFIPLDKARNGELPFRDVDELACGRNEEQKSAVLAQAPEGATDTKPTSPRSRLRYLRIS